MDDVFVMGVGDYANSRAGRSVGRVTAECGAGLFLMIKSIVRDVAVPRRGHFAFVALPLLSLTRLGRLVSLGSLLHNTQPRFGPHVDRAPTLCRKTQVRNIRAGAAGITVAIN